jgi:putative ABC transport system substrate-binding protein
MVKRVFLRQIITSLLLVSIVCLSGTTSVFAQVSTSSSYKVIIVTDTIDDWSQGIIDGFQESLNRGLRARGKTVSYTILDTMLNPDRAPQIIQTIKDQEPDLICMVNFPSAFADSLITSQLTDPKYRFVSENIIPVEMGLIENWDEPGGNVTGVGVFLQQNSQLRIMTRLNPEAQKLVFFSWSAMELINQWFETELTRAAKEEGIEIEAFHWIDSYEEELALYREYAAKGNEYFIMGGISAFVDKTGTPVDMSKIFADYFKNEDSIPTIIGYDESVIKSGAVGGASVIWQDIGAQLAEKGLRILDGANPGSIPWDYPRRYNIILNLATAQRLGISIPQGLLGAAYRVYTDYDGHYVGK